MSKYKCLMPAGMSDDDDDEDDDVFFPLEEVWLHMHAKFYSTTMTFFSLRSLNRKNLLSKNIIILHERTLRKRRKSLIYTTRSVSTKIAL